VTNYQELRITPTRAHAQQFAAILDDDRLYGYVPDSEIVTQASDYWAFTVVVCLLLCCADPVTGIAEQQKVIAFGGGGDVGDDDSDEEEEEEDPEQKLVCAACLCVCVAMGA
jgi:hypothetical protein